MIDPKQDPIAAAREALTALDYGGNWSNVDAPALVRGLLALIDGSDVPPTDAEADANPWWFVYDYDGASVVFFVTDSDKTFIGEDDYEWSRADAINRLTPGRWVPLNHRDHFRPMLRPVVPR